jgi:gliding motility-associated-like protein
VFFSNVGATASNIGANNIPTCFADDTVQRDVWITFVAADTITDYLITLTGASDGTNPAILNPQMALYRGACEPNGLAELACVRAEPGESELELSIEGLTPTITYYLRISDYSETATPNSGSFNLCIEEVPPINLINEEGSTACSGQLYDTGGPDGNYGDDENFVYTICPSQPHQCITFNLEYYNIEYSEFGNPDLIILYDAAQPDPNAILEVIGGSDFGDFGDDSNGGVCYSVQASSGCITVQFVSNGSVNFEGFAANWQCSAVACEENTPLAVATDVTPEDLAAALSAPQTSAVVTNLDCPDGAYGTFSGGDNTDLGLERGVILTSGSVENTIGPNFETGATTNNDTPGDMDLDSLSVLFGDGDLSEDACILELEVFAASDELVFEYVFGSEEYPEFVDQYNDIFAFLISGPGITGVPELNNQKNIAILPTDEEIPVQINSVNPQVNWEFYRANPNGLSLEYDGLTSDFQGVKKSLTARASVTPCETYQLKLAIADRGDGQFDSGVFISDLRGSTPELAVDFVNGVDYLVESCSDVPDSLVVRLVNPQTNPVNFNVVIGGSATLGTDYLTDVPNTVTFAPGETVVKFPITVLSDVIDEDDELITVTLIQDFGCGATTVAELEITLRDEIEVLINGGVDNLVYCAGNGLNLSATGATDFFWSPPAIFDDPFAAEVFVTPEGDQTIQVVGTLGICTDTAEVFLQAVDPMIDILTSDTINLCLGDSVQLLQENNIEDANITWTTGFGAPVSNEPNPFVSPTFDTEYRVTVSLPGCEVSDSVFVSVDELRPPEVINDTTICQNSAIQLAEQPSFSTFGNSYAWTPVDGLDDPTSDEPIATPEVTTTYQLITTVDNGACADTQMVRIEVIESNIDILEDTALLCLGDTLEIRAVTNDGSTDITWSPQVGFVTEPTGTTVRVAPQRSFTYYARTEINACPQVDSIVVLVDSLPSDLTLMFDPMKDPYCQGEEVTITSPIYDPGDFPRIRHEWTQALGALTPDSLYNLVFNTQDTATYTRYTFSGACVDSVSMLINVVEPPEIDISPLDTTICAGESVQYVTTYDESQDISFTWMGAGLSCTECPEPIATPASTTQYMIQIEVPGNDCTFPLSTTINVQQPPAPILAPNPVICFGESLELFLSSPEPGVSYTWSGPGVNQTDPNLTVTPDETSTYTLTATNDCGTVSEDVTVTVAGPVNLVLNAPAQACFGDEVTFIAETDAAAGVTEQFTWIVNGTTVSLAQSFTLVATEDLEVSLSYSYNNCEILTQTAFVNVNPAPSLQFPTETTICLGESITLNEAPNPATTTYQWNGPGLNSTDPAPMITPAATGTYSVTATSPGCDPLVDEVTIEVIGDYTVALPDDFTICVGESVDLAATITPATTGFYQWTFGNQSANTETLEDRPTTTTTYQLTFVDAAGCQTVSDEVTVTVINQQFTLDILAQDDDGNALMPGDTIFSGSEVTFSASVEPATGFSYSYTWTGDGDPATGTGPSIVTVAPDGSQGQNYQYNVSIETDPGGCQLSTAFFLTLIQAEYQIPNIFSPNGDDQNDEFRVFYNGELLDFNLQVYNRWGQLVFESTDPDQAWNGEKDGKPQPMDVYLYRTTFRQNGVDVEDEGEVTLVR